MPRKKLTYEMAVVALENIVTELENGELSLQELTDKYSEGIKMSDFCLAELSKAEAVINKEVKLVKGKIEEVALDIEDN